MIQQIMPVQQQHPMGAEARLTLALRLSKGVRLRLPGDRGRSSNGSPDGISQQLLLKQLRRQKRVWRSHDQNDADSSGSDMSHDSGDDSSDEAGAQQNSSSSPDPSLASDDEHLLRTASPKVGPLLHNRVIQQL